MRRDERRVTRGPWGEVTLDNARAQFQGANTGATTPRGPIQVPRDLDWPRRRQIRFRRRQRRAISHAPHFDFGRADIVMGQFGSQKLAFHRLDLLVQLMLKAFKVGRAPCPPLTQFQDKLSQALNRGTFQNRIGVAQCHRVPPGKMESLVNPHFARRFPFCQAGRNICAHSSRDAPKR